MKHTLTFLLAFHAISSGPSPAAELPPTIAAPDLAFPGETIDTWHGFKRHRFKIDGCAAWVVEPKAARDGLPWSWCMEFPDAFTVRCAAPALLEQGFHHVHISVGNTFGSPEAVKHFNVFYDALTARGLAKKAVLIGISRGGLYAYRFASEHPERVAVIYGDAAVCDFKSWPGGKGQGKGSAGDWAALIKLYGFKDEAEALAYRGNPIDTLAALAKAKVALIHVVGDADDVVPAAENAAIIEQRYRALGGEIQVIHKPGVGHHPHGLDDPTPVVKFIVDHTSMALAERVPSVPLDPLPLIFAKGARVLFQGDSITDGNRGRNADPNHILGHGYCFLIAANFGGHFPKQELVFLNRGVSGNNVTNLAARWPKDTLDLKPDVLSILIGINDAMRVPLDQFEAAYDQLLTDTLAALPKVRLVLGEPFTLPVGNRKENWETWSADVKQRQAVVARIATKHHAPLVRFQKAFDEACQRAPAEHWIWDGVHPTYAGHQIMADEWVRTVSAATPTR